MESIISKDVKRGDNKGSEVVRWNARNVMILAYVSFVKRYVEEGRLFYEMHDIDFVTLECND